MPKVKRTGVKKRIGPYNKYMKTELPKVKEEHPNITHKEAFVMVAKRWKDAPENPKNKTGAEKQVEDLRNPRDPIFCSDYSSVERVQLNE